MLFEVSTLPDPERRACLIRSAEQTGLPVGEYDDEAHATFWQAPASMRAEAERKAQILYPLQSIRHQSRWPDRLSIVQGRFGEKGTSKPNLKRLLSVVKGVDTINYAPALLASYKSGSTPLNITDDTWRTFMTIIRDTGPDFPIRQAWRDVRDIAKVKGWEWPHYVTVNRRWRALPEAQRLAARYGRDTTLKRLSQPTHRDKTTVGALELVSLDGRRLDFWTDTGDGHPVRLTMLALVDVASNMVLDYALAASENAVDTVRLVRRTCETYGIFDQLYIDNGSSFAGHLVAGGNVHRFRNSRKDQSGVQPVGICYHRGIRIRFALPGNAQAKIAERTFATLSRLIDDRPEFKKAHAGHSPGAAPDKNVQPVAWETVQTIIRREIDRHNNETGRQSQGARGRSYKQVFAESAETRISRIPTRRQLYLASLIYTPHTVNRHGQIMVKKRVYGGPETHDALLTYHGNKQRILWGRDPEDLSADALAFDDNGRLICEAIQAIERGTYDSMDGIRTAARNRKASRDAYSAAEDANNYLFNSELVAALAALDQGEGRTPLKQPEAAPAKVVGARFGSPLREPRIEAPDPEGVPAEYIKNFEAHVAPSRAKAPKPV